MEETLLFCNQVFACIGHHGPIMLKEFKLQNIFLPNMISLNASHLQMGHYFLYLKHPNQMMHLTTVGGNINIPYQ